MKFRLHVNVNREDRQVVVSVVCNHCPQEATGSVSGDTVAFRCPTHGKLGSATLAEVQAILERAQSEALQREGWAGARGTVVAHRADEKPS
jgi:hypothetical protein